MQRMEIMKLKRMKEDFNSVKEIRDALSVAFHLSGYKIPS